MLVQKFGGSSLANVEGFRASGALIRRFSEDEPVDFVADTAEGDADELTAHRTGDRLAE